MRVIRWLGVRLITVLAFAVIVSGCTVVSGWLVRLFPAPDSAVSPPPPVILPPTAPAPSPMFANGERARRITATRADLKVALTQLELRAVSACDRGRLAGEGCPEIQQLIDRARAADEHLVKALLNPKLDVDWADVTKLLRLLVEQSKEVKP